MGFWYLFIILCILLAVALILRIYTRKRLDSIDGVRGVAKKKEIERAGKRLP